MVQQPSIGLFPSFVSNVTKAVPVSSNTNKAKETDILAVAVFDGFHWFINKMRRLIKELPKAGIICTQLLLFRHIFRRFIWYSSRFRPLFTTS